MINYICDDTEKFLDELLVVQRAIEKEIREVMTKFRNLPDCGDKEFGKYSSDIWWITNDYRKVMELERDAKDATDGVILKFGTLHRLKKFNPNIERVFKCVYSEC